MTSAPRAETVKCAAGYVLAGGHSSRMGCDKALAELAGRPLIAHALQILRDAGLVASIAGARTEALAQYAPVIADAAEDRGPLAGIFAALALQAVPWAVFLSVDAPLIPASLVRAMLDHARAKEPAITLASVGGFTQTFPAVVAGRALPALEAALGAGQLGVFAAFKTAAGSTGDELSVLPVESLIQAGQVVHPAAIPLEHWFANINAPADLEQIAALVCCASGLS